MSDGHDTSNSDPEEPWELPIQGTCDCVPAMYSSKSCQKCGRRAIITQEHFNRISIDSAQYHYVLKQISEGVDDAQDMAKRVLEGERGVRSKGSSSGDTTPDSRFFLARWFFIRSSKK